MKKGNSEGISTRAQVSRPRRAPSMAPPDQSTRAARPNTESNAAALRLRYTDIPPRRWYSRGEHYIRAGGIKSCMGVRLWRADRSGRT